MTPRHLSLGGFARHYFPAADPVVEPSGISLPCPACSAPHGLRLVATPPTGALLWCGFCLVDILDLATHLEVEPSTLEAHLASVTEASLDGGPAFRVLRRSDLRSLPRPEALIAGTIDRRSIAFVAGAPGSGKSFLLLDWAACIATGTPWLGRPVERGRVLYVVAEGVYGVDERLAAWESHHGVVVTDDGLDIIDDAIQLTDPETMSKLCARVDAEGYDAVVIDTLARCAVGLDESSARDMGIWIAAAERLKRAMPRGTVLIAHHSSKGGQILRGSGALAGAAHTIYVVAQRTDGVVMVGREKNKDGPLEDRHALEMRLVEKSVVLAPEADAATQTMFASEARLWTVLYDTYGTAMDFTRAEAHRIARDPSEDGPAFTERTAYRAIGNLVEMEVVVPTGGSGRAVRYILDPRRAIELHFPVRARLRVHEPDEGLPVGDPF